MRVQRFVPFALTLFLAPVAAAGQSSGGLSSEERELASFIDAHNDEAIALLEQAVNINSGTMNFGGVRAAGKLFGAELERLGFSTRWIDGGAFQRAGHLVAERRGPGPKVLLIGHLDTVFEPSSPFQKFERVSPRAARGPGAIDMKGGDVIIVHALKALKAIGALDAMHVVVVMTGDEESAGDPQKLAREALVHAAQGAHVAIGFEDGDGDPRTAVIGRRGTSAWTLRVTGTPAHSSQIFRKDIGYGAVFEAARIVNAFREKLAGEPHLTFNPSLVLGGTQVEHDPVQSKGSAFGKDNVIAEHAVVSGDIRALSVEQFARARETMTKIASASLPGAKAEITFEDGYPPLSPSDGNRKLLALYDQVSRDLGTGPVTAVDPDRAGAADVSFVAGVVPMILDGVGLMGDGGHTVNETADLTTLPSQTKRAAILLHRLSRGPR